MHSLAHFISVHPFHVTRYLCAIHIKYICGSSAHYNCVYRLLTGFRPLISNDTVTWGPQFQLQICLYLQLCPDRSANILVLYLTLGYHTLVAQMIIGLTSRVYIQYNTISFNLFDLSLQLKILSENCVPCGTILISILPA